MHVSLQFEPFLRKRVQDHMDEARAGIFWKCYSQDITCFLNVYVLQLACKIFHINIPAYEVGIIKLL